MAEAGMRTVCKKGSSELSSVSGSGFASTAGFSGLEAGFDSESDNFIVCIKGSDSGSDSGTDFFAVGCFNGSDAGVVSINDSDSGSGFGSGTSLASGIGISASVGSA